MVCMQTAPLVPTPATRDEISSPPSSSDGTDVPLLPNRTSFPSVFNFPTLATPFRDLGERITGSASFQPAIQFDQISPPRRFPEWGGDWFRLAKVPNVETRAEIIVGSNGIREMDGIELSSTRYFI